MYGCVTTNWHNRQCITTSNSVNTDGTNECGWKIATSNVRGYIYIPLNEWLNWCQPYSDGYKFDGFAVQYVL